jgi:glycosyltransferase involved in cell wall biosynthesis
MPKVSIGLPVYNGENFLEPALDSILNQTFEDFEFIISDNASTDRTEAICRTYAATDQRIRYSRNDSNLGAIYNFNRVFELSSGQYFKWAAHDDVCDSTFVERCVAILEEDHSVVLAFSKTRFIGEHGEFLHDYNYKLNVSALESSKRFFDLAVRDHIVVEVFGVIRSSILRQVLPQGNYVGSDRVLLGELALHGRFFEIPDYLFFHREHAQRSTKAFPSLHSRTAWFDPERAHLIVCPTWKLFVEHLASIRRVPLSRTERVKCYLQMVRWIRAKRKRMLDDVIIATKQLLHSPKPSPTYTP